MPNPGDDARRKLLAEERKTQLRVIIEFKKIQQGIQRELYDVLLRIEHARLTEGNARPADLFEKARLRNLLDQVSDEIFKSARRLGLDTSKLQTAAVNIAQDQAGQYAALRADLSFFDEAATREIIGIGGDGKPLERYFVRLSKPVRQSMFDALYYGVATGQSNQQIAKEVNNAVGNGAAAAMTIVRTETNRAYREASRKFYQDSPDVGGWRWVAALDLTTCPICWAMHGKIFRTNEKMATHPNCRCTIVPVFADDPKPETGPERFAAKLTIEQQRAILGPRRLDLFNQGANLRDFVERVSTPFGPGRRLIPLERVSFKPSPRTPAGSASGPPRPPTSGGPVTPPKASPPAATPKAASIKRGDPVPEFSTAAEFETYLEKRFEGKAFDFGGIDPALMQSQADEIARLMDRYPEVAERLKYFGTYQDKTKVPLGSRGRFNPNALAHAATDGRYIALNPGYFRNAKLLRDTHQRSYAIRWSVAPDDHHSTTHEFGHAVDAWLTNGFRGGVGRDSLTSVYDPAAPTTIEGLRDKIVRRFKPKSGELSDYGRTKKAEQFAEGFSQYWNRPESEHCQFTKAQAKLIELAQTREKFPPGSRRPFSELSEDEQRAVRREINEIYLELGLKSPYKKADL